MATKKTRKQATTLRHKSSGGSGWLTGLFVGLLIGGGVVFYLLAIKPTDLIATSATTVTDNKTDSALQKKSGGPRFEFYNKLKENSASETSNSTKPSGAPSQTPTLSAFDSDADAANSSSTPVASTSTSATPSSSGIPVETHAATADSKLPGKYLLQAGSFRSNSDADKVRANIILLGLPARVESIKNDKGETFYRVYVGSFDTAADMQKAQTNLSANKISTVVVKQK